MNWTRLIFSILKYNETFWFGITKEFQIIKQITAREDHVDATPYIFKEDGQVEYGRAPAQPYKLS